MGSQCAINLDPVRVHPGTEIDRDGSDEASVSTPVALLREEGAVTVRRIANIRSAEPQVGCRFTRPRLGAETASSSSGCHFRGRLIATAVETAGRRR